VPTFEVLFMSPVRTTVACAGVLLFGACATLPALAQEGKARVHKMEIYNGPYRTVHYFTDGASPGDEAALRDLERAENEAAVADQVSSLRRLYVANERALEQRRGQVQPLLYGYSSEYTASLVTPAPTFLPRRNFGWAGFPTPFAVGSGYYYGAYPYSVYPYGAGGGGFGSSPFPVVGGMVGTVSNSLAHGVSDEGRLRAEVLRPMTTPEYAAQLRRNYDSAVARVADSPALRENKILAVGNPSADKAPDLVVLKDGTRIEGVIQKETDTHIVIQGKDKRTVQVLKSEVTQVWRAGAVKPAGGPG
jgi:hypothetical protein